MDVWRITLAALRRWYVLLPLLALTGLGVVSAGDSVEPEYEATATIMYVAGPGDSDLPNPYGSITGVNEVVGVVLNSVETRGTIAAAGHGGAYEVIPESRSSITYLSIRSDNADDAVATGAAVIEAAQAELLSRQDDANIPPDAQVGLQVLEQPTVVATVQDGKLRIQAIVGLVGAGIALLVSVLFDDIVGLWKRARAKGHRGEKKQTRDEDAEDKGQEAAAVPADPASEGAAATTTVDAEVETGEEVEAVPSSAAPRADLPRRRPEPDPADVTNGSAPNGDHALSTAQPSINSALINTNEWVWPGDHGLEAVLEHEREERPRRNPFFDPEFTKRQLEKTKRATPDDGAPAEPAEPETAPKR